MHPIKDQIKRIEKVTKYYLIHEPFPEKKLQKKAASFEAAFISGGSRVVKWASGLTETEII